MIGQEKSESNMSDSQQPLTSPHPNPYFDVEKGLTPTAECNPIVSVTPASTCDEYDPTTYTKPYSPFYTHPCTRASMDSKRAINVEVRASQDLSPNISTTPSASTLAPGNDNGAVKEWTGNKRLSGPRACCKKSGMTYPKQKKWQFLARLPKRQRLAIKLLIALVIVGAMIGIALGITVAVHGSVYNQSGPIGS